MLDELMISFMALIPQGFLGYIILLAIIAVSLLVLGKGADILVDEAVALSTRWGVPKMVIGATIVSLGTTLPEVTVSVMSAIKGSAGLAMGNAVGSVICDTGLILGIAALIKPLPFNKKEISKQCWIQLGAGVLLVVTALIAGLLNPSNKGVGITHFVGSIPRVMGFAFLALLAAYIISTIMSSKKNGDDSSVSDECTIAENAYTKQASIIIVILKLIFGILLVILSSIVLIPTVEEFARRCSIPETVIAATLVAFGTSLPELITAITAARKGHGDLAIGNVIGADILNVLFVVGASAAVTKGGLVVDPKFFYLLFPTMLFVLLVFRFSAIFSKGSLKRPVGFVLLTAYLAVTILSYIF